jgi:RecJ-like exonuclease
LLTHRKSDFVKHNLNNLNSQKKLSTKLIRRLNNANKISSTIDIKKFYLLFEDQRKNLEKILNEVEKEPDGDALIAGLIYTYPSDIKGENNPIWNFFQFGYNKPADHTSP